MKKSNLRIVNIFDKFNQSICKSHTKYNENPLFKAVISGNSSLIYKLSTKGYDLNEQRSCDKFTPLMCAVSHNDIAVVNMLLMCGADTNIESSTGATAISIALKSGDFNYEIINKLLDYGAKATLEQIKYYNECYSLKNYYPLDIIKYCKYKYNIYEKELLSFSSDISSSSEENFATRDMQNSREQPYKALLEELDTESYIWTSVDLSSLKYVLSENAQADLKNIMPMVGLKNSKHSLGYIISKEIDADGGELLVVKRLFLDREEDFVYIKVKDLIKTTKNLDDNYSNKICDEGLFDEMEPVAKVAFEFDCPPII